MWAQSSQDGLARTLHWSTLPPAMYAFPILGNHQKRTRRGWRAAQDGTLCHTPWASDPVLSTILQSSGNRRRAYISYIFRLHYCSRCCLQAAGPPTEALINIRRSPLSQRTLGPYITTKVYFGPHTLRSRIPGAKSSPAPIFRAQLVMLTGPMEA